MATETPEITEVQAKSGLDLATVIGLLVAVVLVLAAIFQGAAPGGFIDYPSLMIVLGGTAGLVMTCYSFAKLKIGLRQVKSAFLSKNLPPQQVATLLLTIADQARKKGVLSIQEMLIALDNQPLLQQGLGMVVDGAQAEAVKEIVVQSIATEEDEAAISGTILRKAADLAPAMGLIGTLIGLVQMLANLDDPNSIGPAMAVALLTTFYGAVLANMFFTPLATKLDQNLENKTKISTMYIHAIDSIARQDNPRRLEMMLNTVLSDSEKVVFFD